MQIHAVIYQEGWQAFHIGGEMEPPQEERQLIISVFFLLLSRGTKVIHPVKIANEIKRFFFYLNTYGFCLQYWSPQGLQMPVAKLYTGRCTHGRTELIRRGAQNKWGAEFASRREKITPKPQNPKTPYFFLPQWVMQFAYKIQVEGAKTFNLGLLQTNRKYRFK